MDLIHTNIFHNAKSKKLRPVYSMQIPANEKPENGTTEFGTGTLFTEKDDESHL